MLNNFPQSFAFVQIHHGDNYATTWGNTRANFYTDFGAYPTSYQDGMLQREGAYGYSTYYNDFITRRAVSTDVTIELTGMQVSGATHEIRANVCLESTGTAKTVRIYIVQLLDYWPTVVNYSRNGFKQAATTQDLALTPGQCQQVTRTMTFDANSWADPNNIVIIAWAQEPQSTSPPADRAEIFQGAIMHWPFLVDCNHNSINDPCDVNCGTPGGPCDVAGCGQSDDCNANNVPDECEPDCNGNGVADECDISGGASLDCQPDGVPDDCQLVNNECNGNGIPDDCDIASGFSLDCDGNGVPDECQPDCNHNWVADPCDITSGYSLDCQSDGVPDECQLEDNDCNGNDVPDECDVMPLPAQTLFNLDSNPGWSTQGLWAFGQPTGGGSHLRDPSSGYTGTNVYGYNLNGDYTSNMPVYYLTTSAIDCSTLSSVELRFRRWLGVEKFDRASIQVSTDATTWTTVWQNPSDATISENAWSYHTYDISGVADAQPTVYIRWGMGPSDGSVTYPGWNLDDIAIAGLQGLDLDGNGNGVPDGCESLAGGDFDGDSDVDVDDYVDFIECLTGPNGSLNSHIPGWVAACLEAFDANADGDVDLADYAEFAASFTGN
ncbi:MAG TPA: hypothetical protein PKK06_09140 [Phycisphaerae bacterium]|nr:hypothetical protein [Phycisphaerae bacterium]HNU45404.1 hypothetical protein [Phycisphaerae bacterium]